MFTKYWPNKKGEILNFDRVLQTFLSFRTLHLAYPKLVGTPCSNGKIWVCSATLQQRYERRHGENPGLFVWIFPKEITITSSRARNWKEQPCRRKKKNARFTFHFRCGDEWWFSEWWFNLVLLSIFPFLANKKPRSRFSFGIIPSTIFHFCNIRELHERMSAQWKKTESNDT